MKPWGREVWINFRKGENIGDEDKKYIMKKLYIKKGTKTSFQYHNDKIETNFLIEGSVEAWFEDKKGHIDIQTLSAGSIWTIPAGIKHRIATLEDIVLMILCVLLPPLAVFFSYDISNEFWIDLLLTLLFFLPGIIYALYVCFYK